MKRIYRITNRDGGKVCDRGTKRECIELLEEQVGSKHWDNGPYLRPPNRDVRTFRKSAHTKGQAK